MQFIYLMFIFTHHTYSTNFIAFHITNGFSKTQDRTKILSKVQYLRPNKKECDNAKNRQCDYSFCKERPRRVKKKKEHWCGVGQGPSNGQVSKIGVKRFTC